MTIQVRSTTHIAKILSGRKINVELEGSASLHDLLRELTKKYGQAFYDEVCDETGYPEEKVAVLLNGTNVAVIGGVDKLLKDGDDVLILPVISGG